MQPANHYLASQKIYSKLPQQTVGLEKDIQLDSVMSELNRLSQSFVHSYQTLENQVEKLNGQLKNEAEEKQSAIEQNQKLLTDKMSLSDRLQNLLAIMPAGVVVIDGGGKVKDCNAMAIDILGRPLLGQFWLTIIKRAFQPQADDGHQVSLKDGRKIHIETKALDSEPGQLVVLTDLTKTRKLQAELSQQQKLSSMGRMIASLAHQIRTPLSAAILYGSHLNNGYVEAGLKKKFSHNLMERLHYIERQVNDMLNFVKGERKQKNYLSVRKLYQNLYCRKDEFSKNIQFNFKNKLNEESFILGDQDSLIGALINLIENACDACHQKNNVNIIVDFHIDENLKMTVADNGCGLDVEQQKDIFEPFYTNKKNGNGLGLAVVHGVVIEHQGNVKVKSVPKQGTIFELNIPLLNKEAMKNTVKKSSTGEKI